MTQVNRDLNKSVSVASSLLPNVRTATANGSGVDLSGYTKAMFLAHIGTITDGTFTLSAEESDDNSTFTAVAAGNLSGAFVAATSSADDTVQEVGYLGSKRYVRAVVTVTGSPGTGGPVGVTVVRGGALTEPQ